MATHRYCAPMRTRRRYLSEHLAVLPLGVPGRLVATHDAPLSLLALLDRPPWERWRSAGARPGPSPDPVGAAAPKARPTLERYEGGRWRAVAPADRVRLAQPAVQARTLLPMLAVAMHIAFVPSIKLHAVSTWHGVQDSMPILTIDNPVSC